jgi:uncharacterized membrane protein
MNHYNFVTTRAEELFVCFRSSGIFILSVVTFIAGWVAWNLIPGLPHFDDPNDFGHLNLILSMEATIATVLLMRDNARSRVREMEILHTIQESVRKLSQIERGIDDIQEDVCELTAEAGAIAEAA